jgi:hypothetical protein
MEASFKRIGLFAVIAILGLSFSSGCRKKADTIAIIKVRDAANQPVVGAQVVLMGESTTGEQYRVVVYDTILSNTSGEAKFIFNDIYQLGQAGVAVLNVEAFKDGAMGEGLIKVEEETTSEEIVYL